ncbi:hypothetical protein NEFER03_0658 [Nematocida sp. LUAm3]|nr:hypothetical protein NEFER03_0658 [Nematocida sp. LUAm3]KAI5175117.1 hypothetical protein NEFER02_1078 [Nematocida sp. LUAm2]KAI5178211.1 hypothetical protein NEFER01_1389 [Nematocida sp. LUAm1]
MNKEKTEILHLLKRKEFYKARDECLQYLEYIDHEAKIYFYLGYAYFELNKPQEAYKAYKKAEACPDAQTVKKEVVLGIAKIYKQEDAYFNKSHEEQAEEELYINSAIDIYLFQNKYEQYKEYILYLFTIYAYTDIKKQEALIKTHIIKMKEAQESPHKEKKQSLKTEENKQEEDKSIPEQPFQINIDIPSEKASEILLSYVDYSLRLFLSDIKSLTEEGAFSKHESIKDALKNLYERKSELESYLSIIYTDQPNEQRELVIKKILEKRIKYLFLKIYIYPESLQELIDILVDAQSLNIDISSFSPTVNLLASDFLDAPLVMGTQLEYKSLLFNTLSPTIIFLRFPNRSQLSYNIYEELEKALNTSYQLKKEFFTSYIYKEEIGEKIIKDSEFQGEDERIASLSHHSSLRLLLEIAMESSNFLFAKKLLSKITISSARHVPSSSFLSSLYSFIEHLPHTEQISTSLYIDEIYANMVGIHMLLLSGDVKESEKALKDLSASTEDIKEKIFNQYTDSVLFSSLKQKADEIYGYGRFLVELLASFSKTEESQHSFSRTLPLPTTYFSIYSPSSIFSLISSSSLSAEKEYLASLKPLLKSLFASPTESINPFLLHFLGIRNYLKGSKSHGVSMLLDLYETRPNDFYLVEDLSWCLYQEQENKKLVSILEDFLRTRSFRKEFLLLLIALTLYKERKDWLQVEKKAKEILAHTGYTYKIQIILSHALLQQKKSLYAKKTVEEVLLRETEDNRISAEIFSIYLSISMNDLENIEEKINDLLTSTTNIRFVSILNKYKKYFYAKKLETAIKSEGVIETSLLLSKYSNVPSDTCKESSSLDHILLLTDHYMSIISSIINNTPIASISSIPTPDIFPEKERRSLLVVASRLILAASSLSNGLENPQMHKEVSMYLKEVNAIEEGKDSAETEYLLRLIRDEDVSLFYTGDRLTEDTTFSRVLHSLIYDRKTLLVNIRELLRETSILDGPFLLFLFEVVYKSQLDRTGEDLEMILLHLSRRYKVDEEPLLSIYQKVKSKKYAPDGS